jgi:Nucleotide-diphospho-sugar transferase
MKVVYAVVAGPGSPFLDWAAASAYVSKSLPSIDAVELCTDKGTLEFAKSVNHHLLKIVDAVRVAPPFDGTARERSRWVKTQVRSMVDGDFVFVDADALPVADFPEVFDHGHDFAAAEDGAPFSQIAGWYVPASAQAGWKINHDIHYNSGIFFIRDNETTRAFGRAWNRKWLEWRAIDKSGVFADQPSFNSAVFESGMSAATLPRKFNILLSRPSAAIDDPRIFHYAASTRRSRYSLLEALSRELASAGKCDLAQISRAREQRNPWTGHQSVVRFHYFLSSARVYALSRARRHIPLAWRNRLVR